MVIVISIGTFIYVRETLRSAIQKRLDCFNPGLKAHELWAGAGNPHENRICMEIVIRFHVSNISVFRGPGGQSNKMGAYPIILGKTRIGYELFLCVSGALVYVLGRSSILLFCFSDTEQGGCKANA